MCGQGALPARTPLPAPHTTASKLTPTSHTPPVCSHGATIFLASSNEGNLRSALATLSGVADAAFPEAHPETGGESDETASTEGAFQIQGRKEQAHGYVIMDVGDADSIKQAFKKLSLMTGGRLDILGVCDCASVLALPRPSSYRWYARARPAHPLPPQCLPTPTNAVNAAGILARAKAQEEQLEDWERVMRVNLTGPFPCAQAAFPLLLAGRKTQGQDSHLGAGKCRLQPCAFSPSILNIVSLTSSVGFSNVTSYGASKAGLSGLTTSLANDWAQYGIRVNAIAPGCFPTNQNSAGMQPNNPRAAWKLAHTPVGRHGQGEELGGAAVFLCSPSASSTTGVVLPVDGGWLARGVGPELPNTAYMQDAAAASAPETTSARPHIVTPRDSTGGEGASPPRAGVGKARGGPLPHIDSRSTQEWAEWASSAAENTGDDDASPMPFR